MISNYKKTTVFRPFHVPINICLFVLHLTLRDLPFSIWHFRGEVTAIAGRKQILASNVVMVPHFVIGFAKRLTTLSTCCHVVILCLLSSCQRCHVPVVSEYTRYYLTFPHKTCPLPDVHYPMSAVHEGLGLIFGVLANSVARKATHSMFVNDIGRFYGVYVVILLERGQKRLKIAN